MDSREAPGTEPKSRTRARTGAVMRVAAGSVLLIVAAIGIISVVGYAVTTDDDLSRRVADGNGYEAVLGLLAVLAMAAIWGYTLVDLRGNSRRAAQANAHSVTAAATPAGQLDGTNAGVRVPLAVPLPIALPVPVAMRPRDRRAGVAVLISASVLAVTVGIACGFKFAAAMVLLGLPQLALAIVGAVLARTARAEDRRLYRRAGLLTAVVNPATILVVFAIIAAVRDFL